MKNLIKSLLVAGLVSFAGYVNASTVSVTVTNGAMTNLIPVAGSVKISQIVASCSGTNFATFQIYDTSGTNTIYTNSAYTNTISYATNYVTVYTNYYNVSNSFTNIALIDLSVSNAATTNFYPLRIASAIPSNSVVKFDTVNYNFVNGAWVTNLGQGTVILTVTYTQ